MLKTSHVMLICAGIAVVALSWGGEREESTATRSWTVDGNSLAIASPCAKTVTIEPSAALSGRIEVSANAKRASELDQLDVDGGSAATIGAHEHRCKGRGPHLLVSLLRMRLDSGPSLAIEVKVPAGAAIEIKEGKSTDYAIGAVDGPLKLDLSGSGEVSAEAATDPVIRLSGSGDAQLDKASGTLDAHLSGSGTLSIARAELSRADLNASGSGDLSIDEGDVGQLFAHLSGSGDLTAGAGKIDKLTIVASGNGDARIDATVADADLSLSGSSDIEVREVTGQVKQSRRGSGEIRIGGR